MLDFIDSIKRYYMSIGSAVEVLILMSPLQVMMCYVNSPAVVLSIFISGKVMFSNLFSSIVPRPDAASLIDRSRTLLMASAQHVCTGSSHIEPVVRSNLIEFVRTKSNLAA